MDHLLSREKRLSNEILGHFEPRPDCYMVEHSF